MDQALATLAEEAKELEALEHLRSNAEVIKEDIRKTKEDIRKTEEDIRKTKEAIVVNSLPSDAPGAEGVRRKSPTPAGKVKASFNLLREDINSLRAMAGQLGTTVTNVLQRAIRDERFIQEQLAEGNRFAVVDREGTAREIIWR